MKKNYLNMNNTDSLRRNFDTLVKSGRSGLVALFGDPNLENGLEYIIYFHSLNTVYVSRGESGSQYFDADIQALLTRALDNFAGRTDTLTLAEIGRDESEFLQTELAGLLWHMVHDDADIPYDESEGLDADGLVAPDSEYVDETFTLFGGDLETDIERFRRLALSDGEFSVDGRILSLGSGQDDGRTVYALAYSYEDTFVDVDTGERVPVLQFNYVLFNYDWRVLYARTRSFIKLNWERLRQLAEKKDKY